MSPRDPRRGLSPEERALWTTFTKTIERKRPRAPRVADEQAELAAPPPPAARSKKPAPQALRAKPELPAVKPPPLVPLDRRTKQRVARGRAAIDARLDLHGYTQSEAHAALSRFLRAASAREAKLVLVITGKSGVLRQQVPLWLGLPELRPYVIGFENAHVAHGGEGALYVRVRRPRG